MGSVYILQSLVNSRYYVGSTDNLKRRLIEHNNGKSTYTKLTKPFKLVYSQEFPSLKEARRVEHRLKRLKSRKIIERIVEDKIIKIDLHI